MAKDIVIRKFSSYGPVDTALHYYAPRRGLIEQALGHLLGDDPDRGGHYLTVWGPRQTGKTWLIHQALFRLRDEAQYQTFAVLKLSLEHLKLEQDVDMVIQIIAQEIVDALGLENVTIHRLNQFHQLFKREVLKKPLILMLDEFDALPEQVISGLVGVFRNIYISRQSAPDKPTAEKDYLLHGVALIGVRAVLGVENVSGSPFNVQRSLHIPNLTFAEVEGMFKWYEQERGQAVAPEVIERLFYETQGQPGLIGWFGELLTETYNQEPEQPLTLVDFEKVYGAAIKLLPNNNILNIISKARQEPYKQFVLEMFRTEEKVLFEYDNPEINYLYLNGVIDQEKVSTDEYYIKFACPFVQKRLFNYFSTELFRQMGRLYDPFTDLSDTITETDLTIKTLLGRYEQYLQTNRAWLLKDAPRRADLRVYEAVFHFNLYMYLSEFLRGRGGQVFPEFPTGNGQVDLIIRYSDRVYALELKSFTDDFRYRQALKQAARYGHRLGLSEIDLVLFVDAVDAANRQKYEAVYTDPETGLTVIPTFVETGN